MTRVAAAIVAGLLSVSAAAAQSTGGIGRKAGDGLHDVAGGNDGQGRGEDREFDGRRKKRGAARCRRRKFRRADGAERRQAAEGLPGLPAGFQAEVEPAPSAASNDVGASVRSSIDHLRPGFLRPSEQLDIELAAREQHVIERFAEIG